ncbi:hypothetical protein BJ165DRAFT_1534566 [Panaeolus papilionaceus]|nr:hypothetical protein BJ165DRAFT_1534566 [Panaeolus papilionaceus]
MASQPGPTTNQAEPNDPTTSTSTTTNHHPPAPAPTAPDERTRKTPKARDTPKPVTETTHTPMPPPPNPQCPNTESTHLHNPTSAQQPQPPSTPQQQTNQMNIDPAPILDNSQENVFITQQHVPNSGGYSLEEHYHHNEVDPKFRGPRAIPVWEDSDSDSNPTPKTQQYRHNPRPRTPPFGQTPNGRTKRARNTDNRGSPTPTPQGPSSKDKGKAPHRPTTEEEPEEQPSDEDPEQETEIATTTENYFPLDEHTTYHPKNGGTSSRTFGKQSPFLEIPKHLLEVNISQKTRDEELTNSTKLRWMTLPGPGVVAVIYGGKRQRTSDFNATKIIKDFLAMDNIVRTEERKPEVCQPDPKPTLLERSPLYSPCYPFFVTGLSEKQKQHLLKVKIRATEENAVFYYPSKMPITRHIFCIKEYNSDVDEEGCENVGNMVQKCIVSQAGKDFCTFIKNNHDAIEGYDHKNHIQECTDILDSLEVRGFMTAGPEDNAPGSNRYKKPGNPVFAIYINSPTNLPARHEEFVEMLSELEYGDHTCGATVHPAYNCNGCKAQDHITLRCPFRSIPGWPTHVLDHPDPKLRQTTHNNNNRPHTSSHRQPHDSLYPPSPSSSSRQTTYSQSPSRNRMPTSAALRGRAGRSRQTKGTPY